MKKGKPRKRAGSRYLMSPYCEKAVGHVWGYVCQFDPQLDGACRVFSSQCPRGGELSKTSYRDLLTLGYKPITEKHAWELADEFAADEVPHETESVSYVASGMIQWADEYERENPPADKDFDLAPGLFLDGSGRLAFGMDLDELKLLLPKFERACEVADLKQQKKLRTGGKLGPGPLPNRDGEPSTYLAMRIGELCERLRWRRVQDDATRGKRSADGGKTGAKRRIDQAARDGRPKAEAIRRFIREYLAAHPLWKKDRALKELSKQKADKGIRGWSKRRLQQVLKDFPASR
jgi:hypothetical protein